MSEIRIHRALHHPNIVAFEHFFEDNENVYILLEICQNQTLNELIKRRKKLTELETQNYSLQLISALKYLHSRRIIHREYVIWNKCSLKLGNLFLTSKMELKVGDFGLASKLEFEGDRKRTICGTPNYIAPEILDGKQGHSYEVDIWSFGIILYTLIIGKAPFEANDTKKTYKNIKTNSYSFPEGVVISSNAKDLITRILNLDPTRRPTLDQISEHPFYNTNQIPKLLPPSTLACPPSKSYLKQYVSNIDNTERVGLDNTLPVNTNPLTTQIKVVLSPLDTVQEKVEPILTQKSLTFSKAAMNIIWVKKWVDYSSKYGLGYLLSNGSYGVVFNDVTKMVLDPDSLYFIFTS